VERDEAEAADLTLLIVCRITSASAAAARIAAGRDGLLAALAAALTRPQNRTEQNRTEQNSYMMP
jgi:hypothetical protein